MVYGNNTASEVSKIARAAKRGVVFGKFLKILQDCITAKYHVQVMLLFVFGINTQVIIQSRAL